MIRLTKLNGDEFILNCNQIQCIESIPESKVILMNRDYYIVKESPQQIIEKSLEYNSKINSAARQIITISDNN